MNQEHDIVAQVYAAKEDTLAADELVRQYLPFIKKETAKFLRYIPVDGRDELSIAMFAFHEAVLSYRRERGAFLSLAARNIRNRLIDFQRKDGRHSHVLSLDQRTDNDEDSRSLLEQVSSGHNEMEAHHDRCATREEINHFAAELSSFGLKLTDIADNCPKQSRTLTACHQALAYAKANPTLLEQLLSTGKVPINALSVGSGVERKTLERHRKYLVAILLAYTNGFEIIREHLRQLSPQKGGQK